MQTKPLPPQEFLKRASAIASYYGFVPIESVTSAVPRRDQKKFALDMPKPNDCFSEEIGKVLADSLFDFPKIENPLQLYHVHPKDPAKKRMHGTRFSLNVFGVQQSIAEALLLQSSLAILEDLGVKNICVHINSVGDKDSMQRFLRELNTYLRKHLADMPAPCREALKRDTYDALEYLTEKQHPLLDHAPRPMQFLSDASRRHLKEVVEFLELSNVPYEIHTDLVGNRDYYSHTIFEIIEHGDAEEGQAEGRLYIRGSRCDELIRKSFRAKLPAASIVLEQPSQKNSRISWKPPRTRNPKLYFIQLGPRAKLLSLLLIEKLRKAHIPLQQAFGNDSLTQQLEEARALGISKALIMGQKEALDGTIILRDMETHAQTIIPVENLPEELKILEF